MIYITGDTHNTLDLNKVLWKDYKEDDYLIICGDVCVPKFGMLQPCNLDEDKAFRRLNNLRCKVLFVDGNHENFAYLNNLPIEEWKGGKVHKISDNIYHLTRGQVFEIEDKKIFTMGGATSLDRAMRVEGYTWFREEDCSFADTDEALNNLKKHDNKVDFIITHTIGREFIYKRMYNTVKARDDYMGAINNFLDYIDDIVEYKQWYFGHFHFDIEYTEYKKTLLYNLVKTIE